MDDVIELDALADSARKVLEHHQDRNLLLRDPHWARDNDRRVHASAVELGWLGLGVAQAHGGLGQPFSALATLYIELGRVLAGPAVSNAAVGLQVLAQATHLPQGVARLEQVMAGKQSALVLACGEGHLRTAVRGDSMRVSGTVRGLLGAAQASHLLIAIEQPEPALAWVSIDDRAISVSARQVWDLSRGEIFEVSLDNLELHRQDFILYGAAALEAIHRAAAHFDMSLACDAIGGSQQLLSETLAYMHTRTQFGRPIASFQALKHRCADLATEIEVARALVNAASQEHADPLAWRAHASACRLQAGAVYQRVSEESIQLHGGIGFTWEQPCHLYLKRARLNDALGGSASARKDQLAAYLLAAAMKV